MKQQSFETFHRDRWQYIEKVIANPHKSIESDFPQRYRELCHHLAVAKSRRYSPNLAKRLNQLVLESHHILYQYNNQHQRRWIWFLIQGFPNALRSNRAYVASAFALFLLPLLTMALGCYLNEELIYSLMEPANVRQFESMYDPSASVLGRERGSETDLVMFGHYINNNIGIGFRTFASGILFGLGSVFFLIFNGLSIGGVAGHLTQLGYTDTFYPFVSGHGALELGAIVFCGAAGLKLGFSLIDPGPYRRVDAIRLAGRESVLIVYGSALMLVAAAFIEAFWSSMPGMQLVKYGFGVFVALLLLAYCCFSGKRYES